MPDTPKIAKKRQREERTVSQMIALYCEGNHPGSPKNAQAVCGKAVCEQCAQLDAYAAQRTRRCRKMDVKTSCDACENHCYKPEMREKIRQVMRYSGPRMLAAHPVAALRHLMGK